MNSTTALLRILTDEIAIYGMDPDQARRILLRFEKAERDPYVEALKRNRGNYSAAARDLGISRATMYRRLRTCKAML